MPLAAIDAYVAELPALLAEWRLNLMEAIILPHLKDTVRKRTIRDTRVLAYEDDGRAVVAPPAALALIGIRVVTVRAEHT